MESFYLLLIAPIFQTVLSIFRLLKRISIPLGVTAILALVIGIIVSFILFNTGFDEIKLKNNCIDCGMIPISFLVIGLFVTVVTTIAIAMTSILIRGIIQSKAVKI